MAKGGMIKVRCPNPDCRKVLAVKAELGGKKGRCPMCGQAMTIPKAPPGGSKAGAGAPALIEAAPQPPGASTGQTVRLRRADVEKRVAEIAAAEKKKAEAKPPESEEEPAGKPEVKPAKKPEVKLAKGPVVKFPPGMEAAKAAKAEKAEKSEEAPAPAPGPVIVAPSDLPSPPEGEAEAPPGEAPAESPPQGEEPVAKPEEPVAKPEESVAKPEGPAEKPPAEVPAEPEKPSPQPEAPSAASPGRVFAGAGRQAARSPKRAVLKKKGPPRRAGKEPAGKQGPPSPTPRTLRRVAAEAAAAAYELSGNTLSITGAIGYDLNPIFRTKCKELLKAEDETIVVDLGPVLYISSSHLGVLAELMAGAEGAGKKVTVRASDKAARVIRLAGLDSMCTLEAVDH